VVWEILNLSLGSFCLRVLQTVVLPVPDGAEIINVIPFGCIA
jgi:hypothetical protein